MSHYVELAQILFWICVRLIYNFPPFLATKLKIAEIFCSEEVVYIILTKTFMTLVLDGIWKNTYFTEKCFV